MTLYMDLREGHTVGVLLMVHSVFENAVFSIWSPIFLEPGVTAGWAERQHKVRNHKAMGLGFRFCMLGNICATCSVLKILVVIKG